MIILFTFEISKPVVLESEDFLETMVDHLLKLLTSVRVAWDQ